MSEYLDLVGFINIRRGLPYIKFDNEVSKKLNMRYKLYLNK